MNYQGSICLTDIPKEQIKKVVCKDGVTRLYVQFYINEMRNPDQQGNTHTIKVAVKKDEVDPNINYYIGKAKESTQTEKRGYQPTQDEINAAQSMDATDEMPF